MASATRPVRTYSRRHSMKASPIGASSSLGGGENGHNSNLFFDDDDDDERPKKRRAITKPYARGDTEENPSVMPKQHSPRLKSAGRTSNVSSSPVREAEERTSTISNNKGKNRAGNPAERNYLCRTPTIVNETRESTPTPSDVLPSLLTTPTKKPRDLSDIFEAVSPQRKARGQQQRDIGSPRSTGVAKRMLSRSRTESSIESSPSRSLHQLTPKSQSFADVPRAGPSSRRDNPFTDVIDQQHISARDVSGSPSASGSQQLREQTSTGRTYAGKSRSFLVALPMASLASRLSEPGMKQNPLDEGDEEYLRDSYAELRSRWGVDNSENDAEAVNNNSIHSSGEGLALYNPLSSITDLRSKGESRRFLDEVGYLFEGLEPAGALSVRRSSALDIVSKLCDQEFWKKAKAAGLLPEIWDQLRNAEAGNGDKVLDPILCSFASLVSEDPRDVSLLASKDDFIETIVRLMVMHAMNDPLMAGVSGDRLQLTKAEKMTLGRIRGMMSASTSAGQKVSIRLLLSNVLSAVPSLALSHMAVIIDSVVGDLAEVSGRLFAFKSGLPLFPDATSNSAFHEKLCFKHVHNCLVILDLYLIETGDAENAPSLSKADLQRVYDVLPGGLVALTAVTDIIDRTSEFDTLRSQAKRCSELAFRVLINLTNGSPSWSEAISLNPYTLPTIVRRIMISHRKILRLNSKKIASDSNEEDGFVRSMDCLCLALALLTNLVQARRDMASRLQILMFDTSCEGQKGCLLGCQCTNGINTISGIVNVYISLLKNEDDDMNPDLHFLRGHLAVLIGLLLLQHQGFDDYSMPRQMRSIIDDLPGPPDSVPRKLDALITNIDEFSGLYATLTSRVSKAVSRGEAEGGLAPSHVTSDRIGTNVVTEVVTSLRALRSEL
ncbi:hypothetical protein DFH11DRAFT_799969 [Phellopilus nigrolimitatus]|nr:hypothetical protein DFH11DRAFT_799969 [Phellopilus nigrolimitatus]